MQTIYFILFCFGIAGIIFWCFKYDDEAEFGKREETKFSMRQTGKAKPAQAKGKWSEQAGNEDE